VKLFIRNFHYNPSKNSRLVKIGQKYQGLHTKTLSTFTMLSLSFSRNKKKFKMKFTENIKIHFHVKYMLCEISAVYTKLSKMRVEFFRRCMRGQSHKKLNYTLRLLRF
jgi:hypothetical protein